MLDGLILIAALSIGQAGSEPPPEAPTEAPSEVRLFLEGPPPPPAAEEKEPPPDQWLFEKAFQGTWPGYLLHDSGIKVYGWAEGSYTYTPLGHIAWPILFQSPTNEPMLNQNWMIVERPVITSGTTDPTFGFRFDGVLPGTDARFIHERGLAEGQKNRVQVDPYQFYLEGYFPNIGKGLDIKLGKVAVPYMAEVTPNLYNPLFSHSYAYYYNPFTHTGLITTLNLSDTLAVGAWFTLGNDVFFDPAATGMFIGVLQYTSPDQNDLLIACLGLSSGTFDQEESFSNQDHLDVVWVHKFSPRFRYVLDIGAGWEDEVPDLDTVTWYWAVNYLGYDCSPQVSVNTRLEFFNDTQGFKTGAGGLYTAITGGVTYKPWPSLWIRPELRYDYNSESRPFGDEHGIFTCASDIILRW